VLTNQNNIHDLNGRFERVGSRDGIVSNFELVGLGCVFAAAATCNESNQQCHCNDATDANQDNHWPVELIVDFFKGDYCWGCTSVCVYVKFK